MNGTLLDAARAALRGDWSQVVRPPLPVFLAMPLVGAGLDDGAAVAVLYLVGSLFQFGAFALFVVRAFPHTTSRLLALLLFVLLPINHSIHHYRNVPTLFSSGAMFLLAAHAVAATRPGGVRRRGMHAATAWAAILVGVGSRTEMLAFVVLLAAGLVVLKRREAAAAVALYSGALLLAAVGTIGLGELAGVNDDTARRYQVYTFMDSTPAAWLSPGCAANVTEDCRVADGLRIFRASLDDGLLTVIRREPVLAVQKSLLSGADNLLTLFGPNLSTFPGAIIVVGGVVLLRWHTWLSEARLIAPAAWVASLAALATSAVPPLSWAPPHPQYHLQAAMVVVMALVPTLMTLARTPLGVLIAGGVALTNLALSAFRYTRYVGY